MKSASLLLCSAGIALGGCTYSVHQAAVGGEEGLPPGARVQLVEASASKNVILGIGGETDYVDEAWEKLLAQCPGEIVAIETRYSTAHNFLSYDDNIRMTGLCVESAASASTAPAAQPLPAVAEGAAQTAPPPAAVAFDGNSFQPGDRILVKVGGQSVPAEVVQAPGDAYFVRLEGTAEGQGTWIDPSAVVGRVK